MATSTRTIKYWDVDADEWTAIEWATVTSGMMVRLYNPDGSPVIGPGGLYEMAVLSDSYVNEQDIWEIKIRDTSEDQISIG